MTSNPSTTLLVLTTSQELVNNGKGNALTLFELLQSGLTIPKALESPQLAGLRKKDPQTLGRALARVLGFYNNQLNLPEEKKLNQEQILLLANVLMQKYWFLKFDEMALCLKKGIEGAYGKLYSVFDATVVYSWLDQYVKERDAEVERIAFEKAKSYKMAEADFSEVSPKFLEVLKAATGYVEGEAEKKEDDYKKSRAAYLSQQKPDGIYSNSYLENLRKEVKELDAAGLLVLLEKYVLEGSTAAQQIVADEIREKGEHLL